MIRDLIHGPLEHVSKYTSWKHSCIYLHFGSLWGLPWAAICCGTSFCRTSLTSLSPVWLNQDSGHAISKESHKRAVRDASHFLPCKWDPFWSKSIWISKEFLYNVGLHFAAKLKKRKDAPAAWRYHASCAQRPSVKPSSSQDASKSSWEYCSTGLLAMLCLQFMETLPNSTHPTTKTVLLQQSIGCYRRYAGHSTVLCLTIGYLISRQQLEGLSRNISQSSANFLSGTVRCSCLICLHRFLAIALKMSTAHVMHPSGLLTAVHQWRWQGWVVAARCGLQAISSFNNQMWSLESSYCLLL